METQLSEYEKEQLTLGGDCSIHTHEVNLEEHRHLEKLESLEYVREISENQIVDYQWDIILVDTSVKNITLTLPKAKGGKKFTVVKKSASNTLTVNFSNGETMLGITSITITLLAEVRRFKGFNEGYIPL